MAGADVTVGIASGPVPYKTGADIAEEYEKQQNPNCCKHCKLPELVAWYGSPGIAQGRFGATNDGVILDEFVGAILPTPLPLEYTLTPSGATFSPGRSWLVNQLALFDAGHTIILEFDGRGVKMFTAPRCEPC